MSEIHRKTKEMADVRMVSFTVDPAFDTPDRLREYSNAFHANKDQWWFLTEEKSALYSTIRKNFLLPVGENPQKKVDAGEDFIHSDRIALVDGKGNIRSYFDGQENDTAAKVLSAITQLRVEK